MNVKGQDGSWDTMTSSMLSGLNPNTYYNFRVKARNVHGWALEWSRPFSALTAQRPNKPVSVSTSLYNLNIRIAWQAPSDNYQKILEYKVLIANNNGTQLVANDYYCNGAFFDWQSTEMHCDVPVKEVLIQEPYSLKFD
jgi:hypothetical protein